MTFGDPELTWTPCPACGCAEVFTAIAAPGEREQPLSGVTRRFVQNCTLRRRQEIPFRHRVPVLSSCPSVDARAASTMLSL
jgi:hypothetical protein